MKLKLIPVKAPWRIQISMVELQLRMEENGDAIVQATVLFAPSEAKKGENSEAPEIANEADPPFTLGGDYRRIQLTFLSTFYAAMQVPEVQLGVIDETRYDWSEVKYWSLMETNPSERWELLERDWRATGSCPDPNMYEIHDDPLLIERGAGRGAFKSYLLPGNDAFIRVIARSWDWALV